MDYNTKEFYPGRLLEDNYFLDFLNTLEVKEVDLEKELENLIEKEKAFVTDNREVKYYNGDSFNHIYELEFIAKHFFELGMLSTITEEDCKLIWNIGDDLPYMPEEDFFKELLRKYKVQKGE